MNANVISRSICVAPCADCVALAASGKRCARHKGVMFVGTPGIPFDRVDVLPATTASAS